jgi:hypothetical protein
VKRYPVCSVSGEAINLRRTDEPETSAEVALRSCAERFASSLPEIVTNILGDYQIIIADVPLDDVKQFASCHLAGRSALLHVQELLRLAERLTAHSNEHEASFAEPDLEELLRQVRVATRDLEDEDGPL